VNGSTRVLGVVGDPIAQVRAPRVWTALFQLNGVNAVCVPLHVQSAGLPALFEAARAVRNVQGLIITIPHKPAALQLIDEPTHRARQVGAVNVVCLSPDGRLRGDILDGEGLVSGLPAAGQAIDGRRALIVGCGGVGSAIAFAVASARVREIALSDVLPQRAEQLVVNPGLTPLLAAARERGCFVQPGSVMSDHQVPQMATFFGFPAGDWSPQAIAQVMAASGRPI